MSHGKVPWWLYGTIVSEGKRWEGVNELSAGDCKQSSTETGNMERDVCLPAIFCTYRSLFLPSTWSALSYIGNRDVV